MSCRNLLKITALRTDACFGSSTKQALESAFSTYLELDQEDGTYNASTLAEQLSGLLSNCLVEEAQVKVVPDAYPPLCKLPEDQERSARSVNLKLKLRYLYLKHCRSLGTRFLSLGRVINRVEQSPRHRDALCDIIYKYKHDESFRENFQMQAFLQEMTQNARGHLDQCGAVEKLAAMTAIDKAMTGGFSTGSETDPMVTVNFFLQSALEIYAQREFYTARPRAQNDSENAGTLYRMQQNFREGKTAFSVLEVLKIMQEQLQGHLEQLDTDNPQRRQIENLFRPNEILYKLQSPDDLGRNPLMDFELDHNVVQDPYPTCISIQGLKRVLLKRGILQTGGEGGGGKSGPGPAVTEDTKLLGKASGFLRQLLPATYRTHIIDIFKQQLPAAEADAFSLAFMPRALLIQHLDTISEESELAKLLPPSSIARCFAFHDKEIAPVVIRAIYRSIHSPVLLVEYMTAFRDLESKGVSVNCFNFEDTGDDGTPGQFNQRFLQDKVSLCLQQSAQLLEADYEGQGEPLPPKLAATLCSLGLFIESPSGHYSKDLELALNAVTAHEMNKGISTQDLSISIEHCRQFVTDLKDSPWIQQDPDNMARLETVLYHTIGERAFLPYLKNCPPEEFDPSMVLLMCEKIPCDAFINDAVRALNERSYVSGQQAADVGSALANFDRRRYLSSPAITDFVQRHTIPELFRVNPYSQQIPPKEATKLFVEKLAEKQYAISHCASDDQKIELVGYLNYEFFGTPEELGEILQIFDRLEIPQDVILEFLTPRLHQVSSFSELANLVTVLYNASSLQTFSVLRKLVWDTFSDTFLRNHNFLIDPDLLHSLPQPIKNILWNTLLNSEDPGTHYSQLLSCLETQNLANFTYRIERKLESRQGLPSPLIRLFGLLANYEISLDVLRNLNPSGLLLERLRDIFTDKIYRTPYLQQAMASLHEQGRLQPILAILVQKAHISQHLDDHREHHEPLQDLHTMGIDQLCRLLVEKLTPQQATRTLSTSDRIRIQAATNSLGSIELLILSLFATGTLIDGRIQGGSDYVSDLTCLFASIFLVAFVLFPSILMRSEIAVLRNEFGAARHRAYQPFPVRHRLFLINSLLWFLFTLYFSFADVPDGAGADQGFSSFTAYIYPLLMLLQLIPSGYDTVRQARNTVSQRRDRRVNSEHLRYHLTGRALSEAQRETLVRQPRSLERLRQRPTELPEHEAPRHIVLEVEESVKEYEVSTV